MTNAWWTTVFEMPTLDSDWSIWYSEISVTYVTLSDESPQPSVDLRTGFALYRKVS